MSRTAQPLRPKSGPQPYPTVRHHMTISPILYPAVQVRFRELHYITVGPFCVEMLAHDYRWCHWHPLTGFFAALPPEHQVIVDQWIVANYRPGQPEPDGLIWRYLQGRELLFPTRRINTGALKVHKVIVSVPALLEERLDQRIAELGYASFSAYMTGLIRFNLGRGGPHHEYDGRTIALAERRKLDPMTVEMYDAKLERKTSLDRMVEQIVGREMTVDERDRWLGLAAREMTATLLKLWRERFGV